MENIIIEIKPTPPDYKTYREFARFSTFWGRKYKFNAIFLWVILTLFIAANITHYSDLVALACIWLVWLLARYFYMPKSWYKSLQPMRPKETTYRFYEGHVETFAIGENYTMSGSYQYKLLTKVYEARTAFYLKMVDGTMLIPKNGLEPTQIDSLRNNLMNCFGEDFLFCYKVKHEK